MSNEVPRITELGLVAQVGGALADDGSTSRRRAWTTLRRDPAFWIGGGLAVAFVVAALLARSTRAQPRWFRMPR